MKKIRQSINLMLSALIVALGFGSCVTQQKYRAAQDEIKMLQEENARLNAEKAQLQQDLHNAVQYRKQMEERKVVYGPRPTGYKEDINK